MDQPQYNLSFRPGASRSPSKPFLERLISMRVGAMLWRNTVVSCAVFMLSLLILWSLARAGMNEIMAAGIGFLVANSMHYFLGRSWIFKGTTRRRSTGYAYFLVNALVGLTITLTLYAALLEFTSLDFLTARVIVSLFAGLIVFALNAVLNFKRV